MKAILLVLLCLLASNSYAELSSKDMQIAYTTDDSKNKVQQAAIKKQLIILNSSISKLEQEINNNRSETKKVKSEIGQLEVKQKELETKLDKELANFNKTTTSFLKIGQVPSEVIVLQDTLQMQQKRTGALSILKQQLSLDIKKSKRSLADLESNLEEQKQKRLELSEINSRLESKIIEFKERRKQQKRILKLPPEIRLKMQKEAVLLANDLNLTKFLKEIKRTKVKTTTSLSKEKLPIKGRIVENFGDKDRITLLPVQGITIEGFARGKIKALHDGRVIYSGTFREYGHLVILEHQSGAHSLYAGFGRAIVDVGDYVNAGDLMGFLPAEEEPSLYFEVRINNKAQEPKKWLERDLNNLDDIKKP